MPGPGGPHRRTILLLSLAAIVGCRSTASHHSTTAPASRPVEPQYHRLSTLLDFETDTDTLFLSADPAPARIDSTHSRSGHASLLLPAGTCQVNVKLSSLLSGRDFPGTWTLAGPHLYVSSPTQITLTLTSGQTLRASRTLPLTPNTWTPAFLDLTPLRQPPAVAGDLTLTLDFPTPLSSDAWLDDLLLADNTKVLVDPAEGLNGNGWSLRREGFNYVGDRPMRFHVLLPTPDVAGGWHVDEANRLRARFHSDGPIKTLALYEDGRSFWDGRFQSMGALEDASAYEAQQHLSASLHVPEDQGRVDRNTPGDDDHDGYNEATGAYQVIAAGRRLQVTVTPHTDGLLRPVLEVQGLPPGDIRATVEGSLAGDVLRLGDGRALIVIPARILRETVIDVRVR